MSETLTDLSATRDAQAVSVASASPIIPTIPGFRVLDILGGGGMGVVYRALQISLSRQVALKMVIGTDRPGAPLERFRTEANAVARLQHPNIVQIYDIGEVQDLQYAGAKPVPYFTMEFVTGGSLAKRLEGGHPQPPEQAARLVKILAEAVHYCHQNKIVHRDLKPGNVLLAPVRADADSAEQPPPQAALMTAAPREPAPNPHLLDLTFWTPKISDFGLAKNLEQDSGQTGTTDILGTPSYMAPEQAVGGGRKIKRTADVYSLGAILYWALTGHAPFKGPTALETLDLVRNKLPVPPRRLQRSIPRDLESICLQCLEKDPARRYPTAQELAEDLGRFLNGDPVKAHRVGLIGKLTRWCRRNPGLAASMGFATLSLLLGSGFSIHFGLRAESNARAAQDNAAIAERNLYGLQVFAAYQDWENGRILSMKRRLADPSTQKLRGFEYHYLQRLCQLDLRTLRGHTKPVRCVAVSPDDRLVASAGDDADIRIWEAATGHPVQTIRVSGRTRALTFGPDGHVLASAGDDQRIMLWDASNWQLISSFDEKGPVNTLAFNRDGSRLASGTSDGIALWHTKHHVRGISSKSGSPVRWIGFSPTRDDIVSIEISGAIKVHDALTGRTVSDLPSGNTHPWRAAFSPDGKLLATADEDHTVTLWDLPQRKRLFTLNGHTGSVYGVVFDPDGKHVASAGADNTIRIWDTITARETLVLRGHESEVHDVTFTHDGRLLVSAATDHTVKIWDPHLAHQPLEWRGHRLGNAKKYWEHDAQIAQVRFTPDGNWLASAGADGTVKIWDAHTGDETHSLTGHKGAIWSIAYSPDGVLLASGGEDGLVQIWNTETWARQASWLAHAGCVYSLAFASDGARLYSAGADGVIAVWDPARNKRLDKLEQVAGIVWCVAVSSDGRHVAAAHDDGTLTIWDKATGWRRRDISTAHEQAIRGVAFSPDGTSLASGGEDNIVRLWDVASGQQEKELSGHTCGVRSVAFSADGDRLISASVCDHTARIWDLATAQEILNFTCEPGLLDARLSPDGLQLVGAVNDGTIKLWDGRTLTDDLSTNRESRGLIEGLFQRALSEREMVERIRADKTIDEAVRRSALEMVGSYVHRLAHCQACAKLDALFAEKLFREEVRGSLRDDRTMPPLVQRLALDLVENYPENAEALRRAAYDVLRAGCDASSYRKNLQQAKRLCELVPSCTEYRDLLGIARYRTGDYKGAVEILGSPERLDLKTDAFLAARNLCFLAMAQRCSRHSQEARATLARAKQVAAQPMDASQQGVARSLMAEADAVLSRTPQSGLPAR